MPRRKQLLPSTKVDTSSPGWRLKQLRERRGLTQSDLARRAGLDTSYLSRVERNAFVGAKPKTGTVNRILDALEATPAERNAVLHVEAPPPTEAEIWACVRQVASEEENSPELVSLVDNHWFRWYMNRSLRAVLRITRDEYMATVGENYLFSLADPHSLLYSRYEDNSRSTFFGEAAASFQLQYIEQEFDSWYLDLVARLKSIPGVAPIWDHAVENILPRFLESRDLEVVSPGTGTLNLRVHSYSLGMDKRFLLVKFTPNDSETASLISQALQDQAFLYELEGEGKRET